MAVSISTTVVVSNPICIKTKIIFWDDLLDAKCWALDNCPSFITESREDNYPGTPWGFLFVEAKDAALFALKWS